MAATPGSHSSTTTSFALCASYISAVQLNFCFIVVQYKQHALDDTLTPSPQPDTSLGACSDDSVDIDMEKLKAEAKEVACTYMYINC